MDTWFLFLNIFFVKTTAIIENARIYDGLGLGEEANFEALNCQASTKFETR
jgi:hypothetical protein